MEQQRKKTAGMKIFLLIFMILICLPAGAKLIRKSQISEITENRTRNTRPALSEIWEAFTDTGEYAGEFSDWFNDNFQFRDLLIRTKNQILYSVFDTVDGVYMDSEGYLYYRDVVAINEVNNEKLDEGYFETFISDLTEVKEKSEELGAEFYFMLPPMKNTVRGERSSGLPVNRKDPTAYERMREMLLSSELSDSFVDVYTALVAAEEMAPTFYKTDFHWNNYGATVGFETLINQIAGETIFDNSDYTVVTGSYFEGGQLNNLSTLTSLGETPADAIKNGPRTIISGELWLPELTLVYENTEEAPLGHLLIVGDSFTLYAMNTNSGICDQFSKISYLNTNRNDWTDLLSQLKEGDVDYILFEKIENDMTSYVQILDRLLGK